MTRVKRGFVAKKRRKKIFKLTKGFRGSHSKLFQTANQQMMKALRYSYFDRKKKKNQNRQIWIRRINAASRNLGMPYNKLMYKIKNNKICLNKKILSEIITRDIKTFTKLITIN